MSEIPVEKGGRISAKSPSVSSSPESEFFCIVCKCPLRKMESEKPIHRKGIIEETYVCKNGHIFSYEGLAYLKFLFGPDWM